MFNIRNNKIKITKGDSAMFAVDIEFISGEKYEMKPGDKLVFTVRKTPFAAILMQVESESNVITLPAEKTKNLDVGNCCFDVELRTAENEVYTITGLADCNIPNMQVYAEVTY